MKPSPLLAALGHKGVPPTGAPQGGPAAPSPMLAMLLAKQHGGNTAPPAPPPPVAPPKGGAHPATQLHIAQMLLHHLGGSMGGAFGQPRH